MAAKRAGPHPVRRAGRGVLRAADLLAWPWRESIAAAHDAGPVQDRLSGRDRLPCELVDFWRFNVAFAAARSWPSSRSAAPGSGTAATTGPLDGFRLRRSRRSASPLSPATCRRRAALMGNYRGVEAVDHPELRGLPDRCSAAGGRRAAGGRDQPCHRRRLRGLRGGATPTRGSRGIHFTGSTATFQHLWRAGSAPASPTTAAYPRLVGETGGRDFVLATPSREPGYVATALIRGAFDFQEPEVLRRPRAPSSPLRCGTGWVTTSCSRHRGR